MQPYALTQQRLDALTSRFVKLLKESGEPQAEMMSAAQRLFEAGLSDFHPRPETTPEEFAETVIAENPAILDVLAEANLPQFLEVIETPGELISYLIPSEFDRA